MNGWLDYERLGEVGDKRDLPALFKAALQDTGGGYVEGGFADRWESSNDGAVKAIMKIYKAFGASDHDVREIISYLRLPWANNPYATIRVLKGLINSELSDSVRRVLLDALAEPDSKIRYGVLSALVLFVKENDIPQISRCLNDDDALVRQQAAEVIKVYERYKPAEPES